MKNKWYYLLRIEELKPFEIPLPISTKNTCLWQLSEVPETRVENPSLAEVSRLLQKYPATNTLEFLIKWSLSKDFNGDIESLLLTGKKPVLHGDLLQYHLILV